MEYEIQIYINEYSIREEAMSVEELRSQIPSLINQLCKQFDIMGEITAEIFISTTDGCSVDTDELELFVDANNEIVAEILYD